MHPARMAMERIKLRIRISTARIVHGGNLS
jgi:hypothetical protein